MQFISCDPFTLLVKLLFAVRALESFSGWGWGGEGGGGGGGFATSMDKLCVTI